MAFELSSLALCSLALLLSAYVQLRRRGPAAPVWTGFWGLLLARYALLAVHPPADSLILRWAGVCAAAAAALLLSHARCEVERVYPEVKPAAWPYAIWGIALLAALLTMAPAPWTTAACFALAVLLGVAVVLLAWVRTPGTIALALATLAWGGMLLPRFPAATAAEWALAPSLFGFAMLWMLGHEPAVAASAPGPDQIQLFRQSVRRSREFEILTQIGTALSSSLDADALLASIHTQLQKLMDVGNFYVAFQDLATDQIRFAFEVEDGQRVVPRARPRANALTEHLIATGRPLLISRDVDGYLRRNGMAVSGRASKSWLGVPVRLQGQTCGVIAVQSAERDAYDAEHLHMLEILASQAGVALDNARLFAEVQRDASQKTFLNHIARLSISTLSPPEMLSTVAEEIGRAFHYDHIAVILAQPGEEGGSGVALQVAAAAGTHRATSEAATPRALESSLAGQALQTGEVQAREAAAGGEGWGLCPQARSGMALPILYAGQALGVLSLESHGVGGFPADQALVLQTLADQIAVALNHATLFQQMQHQAVTDSLTGLKTRRFFMEALQAEWRRARSAPATGGDGYFCIVLVDLDEFKPLNDRHGHIEGDRVLVRVARVLEQNCRAGSVVARYGGDEFTILIPACRPEVARRLPQRLQAALAADSTLAARGLRGSFGLALYPDNGATPEELLHRADADMYRTKRQTAR